AGAAVEARGAAGAVGPARLGEHPGGWLGGAVRPDLAVQGAVDHGQLEPVPGAHAPGEAVGAAPGHAVVQELHVAAAAGRLVEDHVVAPAGRRVVVQADAGPRPVAGGPAIDPDLGRDHH